jgi:tRNA (guanine-N7-)-methyltransferase
MKKIDFIDIGSGYGSLLFGLAAIFPDKFIFGLEIRDKLVNFTAQKIRAYQTLFPSKYDHISVVRANSMKHLCNYFYR